MHKIRKCILALTLAGVAAIQLPVSPFHGGFDASAQLRGGGMGMRPQERDNAPIKWSGTARMTSKTEGVITITATMTDGWHIYGMETPADGPQPTRFTFVTGKGWKTDGKMTVSPAPVKKMDPTFGTELTYWEGKVTFSQKFRLTDPQTDRIRCTVRYMGCDDQTCLPPATEELTLTVRRASE